MNVSTALPGARLEARSLRRPNPLLSVMGWELRRFFASRLFWIQAVCYLLLTCFVVWAAREPSQFTFVSGNVTFSGFVAGTSVWGLLITLPISLTLLAVLLSFVNAEGVTRDLTRRTHELLMATALPNWAYIWGRYLVGLLMSLGLAALMLAAILGMGAIFHLTIPDYPLPPASGIVPLWVGIVLPATALVSSLSFMLGTLFPRQANLVKIGVLVGWIIVALVLPPSGDSQNKLPSWYINWDPTSAATAHGLLVSYLGAFNQRPSVQLTLAQWQQLLLTVENKPTDLSGWFGPHLLIAGLSLLLVVIAMLAFQRFRNTFGA
jgi:ABC-type transport system involved in multi-copper enzyme maturation permease subunit